MKRKSFTYVILYLLTGVVLVWTLAPILWMGMASIKTEVESFSMPPKILFKPTFDTYAFMFSKRGNFTHFLKNSVIASILSTVVSLVLGCLGGYALARGKFKKTQAISFWIISTRMAPIPAVVLPLYMIFAKLGLVGTMPGLVFAYTTFNLPFALWMMLIFFKEVPIAIEEAARVDGYSKFQTFLYITLPTALPGIMATAVLCLMFSWNDYVFASVLTGHKTQTVPVAASLLITQTGIAWGQAMATGTIIVLPMLICGLAVRKYLVKGLSMGAVK
jgi:multiple sugar transport system permease protein